MSVLNKFGTRITLFLLFFVQIFLIGIFLGFGSIFYPQGCTGDCASSPSSYAIQFIAKDKDSAPTKGSRDRIKVLGDPPGTVPFQPIGNPFDTFARAIVPGDHNQTVWCFREGTVARGETEFETEIDEKGAARCRCKYEYHGVDCGQPEVVWRSLFAAKARVTTKRQARNIYSIIRTTEHSLETLEIQLMELIDVVDVVVLCVGSGREGVGVTVHRTRKFLENIDKLKGHSERVFLKEEKGRRRCGPEAILKELEHSLGLRIEDEDLVLLSEQDEILNRKAITYLKWYQDGHDLFRFRLKHIVYGFFWQHPLKTQLKSVLVRYRFLLQSKYRLEQLATMENNSQLDSLLLIGNLNHFGGWYCQLCYQPVDIINYLSDEIQANASMMAKKRAKHKNGVMDEEFATKLIANGVNIYELLAREGNFEQTQIVGGGPMDLIKLYPSTEKHFSPAYVKEHHERFENLVRNQFSRWDLDAVDDYNYYN